MRRSLQCASGYRPAVLVENQLTERSVDIDSDYASACAAPVRRVTGAAGDATTTDPRSRRNRASRRGGHLPTRARSQSNAAACPHLRAPGASVPDGRAVRYDLRNRSRMLAPRILYDYQFDRVPQARTSSAPRSSASFPKTMPSSARRHIALGAEGRVGGEARPLHDTETLSLPRRSTRIFPARAAINAVSYIAPRLAQSCQIVDLRRKFFICPQQKRDQPSRPRCFSLLGTCATSTRMALILLKYLVILNMSESGLWPKYGIRNGALSWRWLIFCCPRRAIFRV